MHFIMKQAYHHCKHDTALQLHFVLKNIINTPLDDPLYQIMHQTLPPACLKWSSWQYWSDQIWQSIGFHPARNDEHAPCPASLTSLSPQKPISFLPPNLHKCDPPSLCCSLTMTTLSDLPHFDFSFWNDGSLLENGQASSILMSFALDNHPTKHQWLSHDTYILAHPAGLTTTPILAEKQALELLPSFIKKIMSSSCINIYLLATTVKVCSLHLQKVLYKITNISAPRLHGWSLTNHIYMLPTHTIVTSMYNIFLDMLAFNQSHWTTCKNHMLLHLQHNNNPSFLIQISLP